MGRLFVVDAIDNKGLGIDIASRFKLFCDQEKLSSSFYFIHNEDDAYEIGNTFKNIPDTIIYVIGGDGIIRTMVKGMIGGNNSIMVIPTGKNNLFSLNHYTGKNIDIGMVNNEYFINYASIGFSNDIVSLNKFKLVNTYMKYKASLVAVNGVECNLDELVISNGKYWGDGHLLDRKALVDDGLFSIAMLCNVDFFNKVKSFNSFMNGKFDLYRSNMLELHSKDVLRCNVDGNIIEDSDFKVQMAKDKIMINREDNPKLLNLIKSL